MMIIRRTLQQKSLGRKLKLVVDLAVMIKTQVRKVMIPAQEVLLLLLRLPVVVAVVKRRRRRRKPSIDSNNGASGDNSGGIPAENSGGIINIQAPSMPLTSHSPSTSSACIPVSTNVSATYSSFWSKLQHSIS
ncbi:hypothetical protein OIU79_016366 [Salix purpurea]|uniref:Uncharacterized protein n=1 Tax=Salix purpurea TaxID=77065 RepID=A0A9Q0SR20_SALPP|nr:hypothetical protein OIU79_016366 [Salix purpurea]